MYVFSSRAGIAIDSHRHFGLMTVVSKARLIQSLPFIKNYTTLYQTYAKSLTRHHSYTETVLEEHHDGPSESVEPAPSPASIGFTQPGVTEIVPGKIPNKTKAKSSTKPYQWG